MMKFVIVKHPGDSGKYLFRVPKKVFLSAGDRVVCNTVRGNDQLGICCCDSFLSDPEIICPLFGTTEKNLRYVTGKVEYDMFDPDEEDEKEG